MGKSGFPQNNWCCLTAGGPGVMYLTLISWLGDAFQFCRAQKQRTLFLWAILGTGQFAHVKLHTTPWTG